MATATEQASVDVSMAKMPVITFPVGCAVIYALQHQAVTVAAGNYHTASCW
jgi:hypothetical protein